MNEPAPPSAVDKFFACLVMAAGGLMAAFSGTCTLALVGTAVVNMIQHPSNFGLMITGAMGGVLVVAIFGGVPFVAGVVTLRAGWRMYRPRPPVGADSIAVFGDDSEDSR